MSKIGVAVLGATGMVGQRFVQLVHNHPWFEIQTLIGSERSAGKTYTEACRWLIEGDMPASVRDMPVMSLDTTFDAPLVFSALPGGNVAGPIEERLAAEGHIVCSNASSHRMAPDVPLLVPEVNPEHIGLIDVQRKRRGWSGAIVTNPNCTATPLVMVLRPLIDAFGVDKLFLVSMQAISGAGYPGVPSYDAIGNVVPFIGGEEEKTESEPQKMLGTLRDGAIEPASFVVSSHCNRVGVIDGHMECLSIAFTRKPSQDELIATLRNWRPVPQELNLPSAPKQPIIVREEADRPQPRRDVMSENGMATVVGRLRPCSILDYKFVALAHNTIRGAAGGSLLNAELLVAQGVLSR